MEESRNEKTHVSIKVDTATYEALKKEREATGVPISRIIRFAVKRYIKK